MSNITVVEAADAIPAIVSAKTLGYLQQNSVLSQLVSRDWSDEVASYGQVVSIIQRGTLVANDKLPGNDVTIQAPAVSHVDVRLDQHKEASFIIEDTARWFSRPDLQDGYIADAGQALVEAIEADLAGLHSGLSVTVDATTKFDAASIREVGRKMNIARIPQRGRVIVLHPDAYAEAGGWEELTNRDYTGDEALAAVKEGYLGRYHGFSLYLGQAIEQVAGENKNLAFHPEALTLVTRPMAAAPAGLGVTQFVLSENGIGLRTTMSYDSNALGLKVTVDVLYGVAEVRDAAGVVLRTTAAA